MGVAVVRVGAPSVAGMVGCAGLTRSLPRTLTISPLFSASEDGTGDDGVSGCRDGAGGYGGLC